MCIRTRWMMGLAAAGLLLAVVPGGVRADDMERELLRQAPRVLRYLKDKGCHNAAVLKFLVKKGEAGYSDHAGLLNLTLAQRLELALVLANDVRDPLGIIHDASAVANRLPGANHLTREGRQRLFAARYPLAWGKEEVAADAFVTGVARVSPDLRSLTVTLVAYGKDGGEPDKVARFTADMDPVALVETGESFLLRGAFDSGKEEVVREKVVQTAARVKDKEDKHPLVQSDAPVELEVRYDGQPVRPDTVNGQARIPEPREGQKVTFVLRRKGDSKERYAVVLKVNGENTLYRQRRKDLQCNKWVLDPGDPPIEIRGYQLDQQKAEEFRVLSRAESKGREMYYGADVGTISLVVFREQRGRPKPARVLTDEEEDLAALSRGISPPEPAKNLAALKQQLREDATRGLIAEGAKIEVPTERVKFVPDPVPVMTATLVYYHP
jgi:hypothetical protein